MPDEKRTEGPNDDPNVHKVITELDGIRLTSRFKIVCEGPGVARVSIESPLFEFLQENGQAEE